MRKWKGILEAPFGDVSVADLDSLSISTFAAVPGDHLRAPSAKGARLVSDA
jgi:hypothetical protein